MERAKRGRASCLPNSGHLCLKEEEELAAFAKGCQAPHFFPVILIFHCIMIPTYHGGSRWIFLDPPPKASVSGNPGTSAQLAPSAGRLSDLQVRHALALGDRCAFQAPLRKLGKGMSQSLAGKAHQMSGVGGELEEEREMKKGCGVMARAGRWQQPARGITGGLMEGPWP